MVAAAEQAYHGALDDLAKLITAAKLFADNGHSELEAVTGIYMTLRLQEENPAVLLVCAAAIVRLATSPQPTSALRPDKQPPTKRNRR